MSSGSPADVPGQAVFEFRGKTYTLPAVPQADKKLFAAWAGWKAVQEAKADIELVNQGVMPRKDYEDNLSLVTTQKNSGWWAWGTQACETRRCTPDGTNYLCWLCLKHNHPDVTLTDVEAMAAVEDGNFLVDKYLEANANFTAART